ncbi:MAG: hypothetical protein ACO1QR_11610 [Chthoniobacteraceae bacterium]
MTQPPSVSRTVLSQLLFAILVTFCSGGGSLASAEGWEYRFIGSEAEVSGEATAPAAAVPRKDEATHVAWVPLQFTPASGLAAAKPSVAVERAALRGIDRLQSWRFSAAPGRGPPQVR